MATSCFFCQNLLSDFIEGILPSSRHEELKKHLGDCKACTEVHKDLSTTLEILHELPSVPLSHEMALRVTEASHAGRVTWLSRVRVSQMVTFALIPLLVFGAAIYSFPQLFPWFYRFRVAQDESQFVRYFPLLQGATEIIEEQSNWLHVREPMMRSLWEEGGLSPEEFEKSFQGKGSAVPGVDKGGMSRDDFE